MNQETKNKFTHLASLKRNPLSNQGNIQRKMKELEWVNTANWQQEDWQLYQQVFNL